jgi:hypothetical protein
MYVHATRLAAVGRVSVVACIEQSVGFRWYHATLISQASVSAASQRASVSVHALTVCHARDNLGHVVGGDFTFPPFRQTPSEQGAYQRSSNRQAKVRCKVVGGPTRPQKPVD